jgi:hypothetical protein
MELETRWQEHELGSYPTIVLTWEEAMRGAPSEYIAQCERALMAAIIFIHPNDCSTRFRFR